MRTLLFVLLLGVAVTAALLWNRKAYAPVEVGAGKGSPAGKAQERPLLPVDKAVLVLGVPPGGKGKAPVGEKGKGRIRTGRPHPSGEPPAGERPGAAPPSPPRQPPPEPAPRPLVRKARLKKGETVYGLAERLLGEGRRYREILELNGLDEEKARRLPAGTVLRIPSR